MYKSRYKKRANSSLKFLPFLLLFVLFVLGGVFLVRADFLKVTEIAIESGELVPRESVALLANTFMSGNKLLFIPRSNIFFVDSKELEKQIASQFGGVENVEVDRKFFSTGLDIKLGERRAEFVFCSFTEGGESCANMSRDGFIFEEVDGDIDRQGKIVFYSSEGRDFMRTFIDTRERVDNYMRFLDSFGSKGFQVFSVNIGSLDQSVFDTSIGKIIFNPSDDPYSAAQNAGLLIEDVRKQNPEAVFEYIDTRFGNKMFYKLI